MNSWKRVAWWVVLIVGLGGAYCSFNVIAAQMNARWYRQPVTQLDQHTFIEVVGDALADECHAVYVSRYAERLSVTTLGKVRCR